MLSTFLSPLHADEPPGNRPSRTVGSVYGKAITADDIGLTGPVDPAIQFDARDEARWKLLGRVAGTFGGPVLDRFVARKKIKATADEVDAFRRVNRRSSEKTLREAEDQLAAVKGELAAPGLTDESRARMEAERARIEKFLPTHRDMAKLDTPEEIARQFIISWKIERELHRTYGGRVIFQQVGPEALDARRLLFDEAEKNGDLKFEDPGVRHLFYYYANMRHGVIDEKALDRPWFLDEGPAPSK